MTPRWIQVEMDQRISPDQNVTQVVRSTLFWGGVLGIRGVPRKYVRQGVVFQTLFVLGAPFSELEAWCEALSSEISVWAAQRAFNGGVPTIYDKTVRSVKIRAPTTLEHR